MLDRHAVDALAVYRITRLLTADTILDGPRGRFIAWANRRRDANVTVLVCPKCSIARTDSEFLCPLCRTPDAPTLLEAGGNAEPSKLAYWITCPWCLGVWVAAGVVIARRVAPRVWDPVARLLALSAIAGAASTRFG